MTQDSDLENEKFANRGVSLCMSEWPEKGNMRRRWTFQRMGHPEDAVKIDDTGAGRVVTTAAGKSTDKPTTMLKTRKRQLQKSKGKKSGDTVMVEPEDKSSPISVMEQDVSSKTISVKKKRSPLATRNKQARIEAEERREYREESQKEKQKKTKDEKKPKQSPQGQKKTKSEDCSKKCSKKCSPMAVKKTSSVVVSQTSTKAPKKVVATQSDGCHIEKKMDKLTELVESLIVKVDNLQKTLSDEQRIRASKDPRLADLLTRVEQTANNLNSHYQNLVILDNFPKEKKDDLKKMADDIRRLNNQR